MTQIIRLIVIYIVAMIFCCCTQKKWFYHEAFQMGIVHACGHLTMWAMAILAGNEAFAYFANSNKDACIVCVMLTGIMGGLAFLVPLFPAAEAPLVQFWHDYKTISNDKSTPCISYSLFKKMRKLNPDYFEEIVYTYSKRLECLKYHGKPYRLNLPDYILAMLYIDREERHKINTRQAERDLYAIMQADLDKQLDSIVKDRDAALRSVEKAARETQDILANMEGK